VRALLAVVAALAGAGPSADPFAVQATGVAATASGDVRVEAVVSGGRAARVEFVVDGWLRHTERQAPYEFEWQTERELDGRHRVELWAVAEDGRVAAASLDVRVANRFAVAVTAPGRAKGEVRIAASATGDPQWVELLVDGEVRDVDERAPFSTTWDTREEKDGRHVVSIWAVGPNGVISRDSATVTVRNGLAPTSAAARELIARYRTEAHRWQSLMRVPRTDAGGRGGIDFWRALAQQARAKATSPPHLSQFLCIHRYEGAWNANTGNGYFGGLQMNMDFMRGYGPELLADKGTANNWTPLEQIWVAERAVPRRGFNPWPQTARMCGLL
jgi:hypothetical protein